MSRRIPLRLAPLGVASLGFFGFMAFFTPFALVHAEEHPPDQRLSAPVVVLLSLEESSPRESWPEAERRTSAELEAAGLTVITQVAEREIESQASDELRRQALLHHAVASFWIARSEESVLLGAWFGDRNAETFLEHTFPMDDIEGPDQATSTSLAVVEVLNANLLELRLLPLQAGAALQTTDQDATETNSEPPSREDSAEALEELRPETWGMSVQPDAFVMRARRRDPHRFRFWFAPCLAVPVGLPGVMGAFAIGGGARLFRILLFELDSLVTFTPITEWREEGILSQYFAKIVGSLSIEPWTSRLIRAGFGIGGGVLIVWTDSVGTEGYIGIDEATSVGLLTFNVRAVIGVTRRFRILLAANVGVSFPEIVLHFPSGWTNSIGRPLIDFVAGFEWGLGASLASGGR